MRPLLPFCVKNLIVNGSDYLSYSQILVQKLVGLDRCAVERSSLKPGSGVTLHKREKMYLYFFLPKVDLKESLCSAGHSKSVSNQGFQLHECGNLIITAPVILNNKKKNPHRWNYDIFTYLYTDVNLHI